MVHGLTLQCTKGLCVAGPLHFKQLFQFSCHEPHPQASEGSGPTVRLSSSGRNNKTPTQVSAGNLKRLNMNNASTLMWGVIFGSIGLGFFVYGKKQKTIVPILCGIGLMVSPYFISNIYILVFSGIVLVALPFFIKI